MARNKQKGVSHMKLMNRLLPVLLALCLLTGCGETKRPDPPQPEPSPESGNLLETASPETSALILYCYDGETVTARYLFDVEREREIIAEINALSAAEGEESDLAGWQCPSYGLWISDKEGLDISVAWSDGLWLDGAGKIYHVAADFPRYWTELEGEMEDDSLSVLHFPNSEYLSVYDSRFLSAADTVPSDLPAGLTLEVTGISEGVATLTLTNESGSEFCYGEYFALQQEIDGVWYDMVLKDNVAFVDIGNLLPTGEQTTFTKDLSIYGQPEPGRAYRIVMNGLTAEFAIASEALCGYPPAEAGE